MNKPITIRAQMKFVLVHSLDRMDGQSTLGYSMTCVVIKILVTPKGRGEPGTPMPVFATAFVAFPRQLLGQ